MIQWLIPAAVMLSLVVTEIFLIIELRGVRRETESTRKALSTMLQSWAAITILLAAVEHFNKKSPGD